jgi:hypothetical protein
MWLTVTTNKMRIYIQEENKTRKIKGPANFKKCLKWVDFVQTSWNTNSKLFEAAVCWTMCLTVTQNKVKIYNQIQKCIEKSNDLQISGIASNEVGLKQT